MRRVPAFALTVLLLSSATFAREPERVERDLGPDHFAAGRAVLVRDPVAGDLIAAGGEVDVQASISGDTVLAGGALQLQGAAGQDLYAAGGRVSVDAPVARNARVAGGSVQISPKARIAGGASLAGGRVRVLGPVDGYLTVAAGSVYIDSVVSGPVEIFAREIELGQNARLPQGLRYSSREELVRHPNAQVGGKVERMPVPRGPRFEDHAEDAFKVFLAVFAAWVAGLMLLGALLAAAFPAASAKLENAVRQRFGWNLLAGLIGLVIIPVAAVLLAITVIGIPLALLAALSYVALLLVGFVLTGMALGELLFARTGGRGRRAGAAALGILIVTLLCLVPFLGALVALVALLAGMGAMLMQFKTDASS